VIEEPPPPPPPPPTPDSLPPEPPVVDEAPPPPVEEAPASVDEAPPVEEAPPVDDAPPPTPLQDEVEAPPPPGEEPGPDAELGAPPPPPGAGTEGLPPALPEDLDEPGGAVDEDAAAASDASDVMPGGQPGAEPLPEDLGIEPVPVEADWVSEGEPPFAVSEREIPLDSIVGPGQPFELRFDDQQDTGYCAVCCAHTVLSEVAGREIPREEIVSRAADGGWLSFGESGEARGTSPEGLGDLLDSYGIASSQTTGEADAFERLDRAIADDRRVIVPLDQPGFGAYGEDTSVAITAVDREAGTVLARDSAEGSPIQIPLGSFEQAWSTSDYTMTSVEDSPYDVLGMTLHPDFGLASSAEPLDGLPAGGAAALGDWWAAAGDPAGCCQAPEEAAATPLGFTDGSGDVHQLPGIDSSGTGQADTAQLDANGDGQIDTWMFDTTDTGQADLLYYDSDGAGQPDSVSCCADDGQWTEPGPLSTALNYWGPGQQLGTPIAVPESQVPAELAASLPTISAETMASRSNLVISYEEPANAPNLVITNDVPAEGANLVISYDQPADAPNLVITYDQPAEGPNLVITDPPADGGGWVVLPSMSMAPTSDQQNALSAQWGDHWAGPNPFGVDLMQSVQNPSPRLDPNFTDVYSLRRGLERMYAHQSIVNNVMLLPDGIERRFNPLTGSTIDVPRGSLFP
jgi:hypothetical protein